MTGSKDQTAFTYNQKTVMVRMLAPIIAFKANDGF